MARAWEIRREAAGFLGIPAREFLFGLCLKQAWAEFKAAWGLAEETRRETSRRPGETRRETPRRPGETPLSRRVREARKRAEETAPREPRGWDARLRDALGHLEAGLGADRGNPWAETTPRAETPQAEATPREPRGWEARLRDALDHLDANLDTGYSCENLTLADEPEPEVVEATLVSREDPPEPPADPKWVRAVAFLADLSHPENLDARADLPGYVSRSLRIPRRLGEVYLDGLRNLPERQKIEHTVYVLDYLERRGHAA